MYLAKHLTWFGTFLKFAVLWLRVFKDVTSRWLFLTINAHVVVILSSPRNRNTQLPAVFLGIRMGEVFVTRYC